MAEKARLKENVERGMVNMVTLVKGRRKDGDGKVKGERGVWREHWGKLTHSVSNTFNLQFKFPTWTLN